MIKDVKIPFKLVGGIRVDDTPVHKALREALANCLINTDFFVPRGVVIKKEKELLVLENPGYIRTGKKQQENEMKADERYEKKKNSNIIVYDVCSILQRLW